jgi:hypothetical protein
MVKIPDNWRELEPGEIIIEGDKFCPLDSRGFDECQTSIGTKYKSGKSLNKSTIVIRKKNKIRSSKEIKDFLKSIYIKAISQLDYIDILNFLKQYFEIRWEPSDNDFSRGYVYVSINSNLRIDCSISSSPFLLEEKEVLSFSQVLAELNLNKDIIIPEEKKESIINNLKNNRAFNEDSALSVSSEDSIIYKQLNKKGLIKEYKERFYV